MIDGIGIPQIGLGTGWGVAAVFVLALLLGRLKTRKDFEDGIAAAGREVERAEHDRQEWRAESRIKDAQLAEKDEQLRHMAELGRLVESILRSLRKNAEEAS